MEKTQISAKIIADSISKNSPRVVSFVCTLPRIVLAELNTHRVFSRNSASSRAVPFETMLHRVESDPFIPIAFQVDHKGMQGTEYFSKEIEEDLLIPSWLHARDMAIQSAKNMAAYGVTKQIVNRLLEPFMWHTVIITSTEWDNFFALRAHSAAEIHIQELAYKMLEAMNSSTPKFLNPGEWHIPFGENFDYEKLEKVSNDFWDVKLMIATARCARVSYINYEGKDDYEADIKLFNNLTGMGHWSPFEHCCTPLELGMATQGNLLGWKQLRANFDKPSPDSRLTKISY